MDYNFIVFNRWGEVLFESYDSDFVWNGSHFNGDLVEGGVYVWKIEFGEITTDKRNMVVGHLSLIR